MLVGEENGSISESDSGRHESFHIGNTEEKRFGVGQGYHFFIPS